MESPKAGSAGLGDHWKIIGYGPQPPTSMKYDQYYNWGAYQSVCVLIKNKCIYLNKNVHVWGWDHLKIIFSHKLFTSEATLSQITEKKRMGFFLNVSSKLKHGLQGDHIYLIFWTTVFIASATYKYATPVRILYVFLKCIFHFSF